MSNVRLESRKGLLGRTSAMSSVRPESKKSKINRTMDDFRDLLNDEKTYFSRMTDD